MRSDRKARISGLAGTEHARNRTLPDRHRGKMSAYAPLRTHFRLIHLIRAFDLFVFEFIWR